MVVFSAISCLYKRRKGAIEPAALRHSFVGCGPVPANILTAEDGKVPVALAIPPVTRDEGVPPFLRRGQKRRRCAVKYRLYTVLVVAGKWFPVRSKPVIQLRLAYSLVPTNALDVERHNQRSYIAPAWALFKLRKYVYPPSRGKRDAEGGTGSRRPCGFITRG